MDFIIASNSISVTLIVIDTLLDSFETNLQSHIF